MEEGEELSSESEVSVLYEVEELLGKRTKNGKLEYLVAWKGYPRSESTWEPAENIGSPGLVTAFEESLKQKTSNVKTPVPTKKIPTKVPPKKSRPKSSKVRSSEGPINDFAPFQGLIPEAIVGTTDSRGQVLHLVKWEGKDELELVPAQFTTLKFPHIVLAFYRNRVNYMSNDLN